MPVERPSQVMHRGAVSDVGVDDQVEPFELLQDPIDRRRADVGRIALGGPSDFLGAEVVGQFDEYTSNCSLSYGHPPAVSANGRNDVLESIVVHGSRLGRRNVHERPLICHYALVHFHGFRGAGATGSR